MTASTVPPPAAPTSPLRVAVALSGSGSTLQNLLDRSASGALPIHVVAVASSKADVRGLQRARDAGLPTLLVDRETHPSRRVASLAVYNLAARHDASHLVLAGYLRKLWVPAAWHERVVNVHPALLPAFGGKGMYGDRVHQAVLDAGVHQTGCTVHWVDNEYDHGPTLLQRVVPVRPRDTVETLRERVQSAEREALPEALTQIAKEACG